MVSQAMEDEAVNYSCKAVHLRCSQGPGADIRTCKCSKFQVAKIPLGKFFKGSKIHEKNSQSMEYERFAQLSDIRLFG